MYQRPLTELHACVYDCVTSAITATHSCRCIAPIASHVLRTLDRPACNASLRLPHSPSVLSLSTSGTTSRRRLGPYLLIISSSWLPRGPANLHRALVLRLSPQVQCSSPFRFHWMFNNAARHPNPRRHGSNHPVPVHWEASNLLVSAVGSSLQARNACLYISDSVLLV
jgi:hypothetical protein